MNVYFNLNFKFVIVFLIFVELPRVLSQIKETLDAIQNQSISSSPSVTSDEFQTIAVPEMVSYALMC